MQIHFVALENFIRSRTKFDGGKHGRMAWTRQVAVATLLYMDLISMVPASFSNTITRGGDWTWGFQIREQGPCSALADLTDWAFTSTLTTAAGASLTTPSFLLHTPECPVFSLTHTQTAALARQTGAILTIHAVRPDGFNFVLARGRVTIN